MSKRRHALGLDGHRGPQKVHVQPTSRLGGLGIMIGLACALALMHAQGKLDGLGLEVPSLLDARLDAHAYAILLVCALPVFFAGLVEDITHQVSPLIRFLVGLVSASMAWVVMGVSVTKTGVYPIDLLLASVAVSYVVTLLVVVGFTHAMNIIDGFHGLASGQVVLMSCGLAYICYQTQQVQLLVMSLVIMTVVLGFLTWNWPWGLIFLGDSGAYLLGFLTVCIGLLLVKTEARVSPMAPVLLGAYPLIETLWSIYRRSLNVNRSVARPDALHLHSLIYRRLFWSPSVIAQLKTKINEEDVSKSFNVQVNAWVSPLMLSFFLLVDFVTCLNYQDTPLLLWTLLAFTLIYLFVFLRLVHFKTPLVMRKMSKWVRSRKSSRKLTI